MPFRTLDTVVAADLPSFGLKREDIGAVVQIYSADAMEVEFVTASGRTQAVLTLGTHQLRPVGSRDVHSVRQVDAA
jgi:hypothetical protein